MSPIWLFIILFYPLVLAAPNHGLFYMTPPFASGSYFSVVTDKSQREFVQHFETDQKYSVRFRLEERGNKLMLVSGSSKSREGVIFYDGFWLDGKTSTRWSKIIGKNRLVAVFYDPSDIRASKTLESRLVSVVNTSCLLDCEILEYGECRKLDGEIQTMLGGSLSSPRCYVAIFEPPYRTARTKFLAVSPPRKKSKSAPTNETKSVILYMTEYTEVATTYFSLLYMPEFHGLQFAYTYEGRSYRPIFSLGNTGEPKITGHNGGRAGVMAFDEDHKAGCCFNSLRLTKRIGMSPTFLVFYNPNEVEVNREALGRRIGNAINSLSAWRLSRSSQEVFTILDETIQDLLVKYTASKGYLVVIEGIDSMPETVKKPRSASGSFIENTSEFLIVSSPSPPMQDHVPRRRKTTQPEFLENAEVIVTSDESKSDVPPQDIPTLGTLERIQLPEYEVVTTNLTESDAGCYYMDGAILRLSSRVHWNNWAEVRLGDVISCSSSGSGKFRIFEPEDYLGLSSTAEAAFLQSHVYVLLWLDHGTGTPFDVNAEQHLQLALLTGEATIQQMTDSLAAIAVEASKMPFALIKIKRN